jgi:alpha-glucuronidase
MSKKITLALFVFISAQLFADDGYRLWLKYDLIKNAARRAEYKRFTQFINTELDKTPMLQSAEKELRMGISGLLGHTVSKTANNRGGIILKKDLSLSKEGYTIVSGNGNILISAATDKGILYGAFAFLREMQMENTLSNLRIKSEPRIQLRMLNHWDNPLGTIERGYAGASLWKWYELPENIDPRYIDYARANASIGINAVAINNVNASPRFLTSEYLPKVKALADAFRPYGIQVFLSVNFASPKVLGKLKTSDPLDPAVRAWWKEKTKEVYDYIPDFGGFLVKANSEGEPGPQEYNRTHADGANMLAEAVKPYNGLVIWRAFVYSPNPQGDRFKEAFNEFTPLDGQFAENVVVQVKNGPIDFQPREPFHPLFGAMPNTPLAMEFQITQEYLGFSTNLVYLATLFKECLDAETTSQNQATTVAKIIEGSAGKRPISIMAGVANTGSDRNWTGHFMSQANWYAFGRLAWNHTLSAREIGEEWTKMTLTRDQKAVQTIADILMRSRETYVNFTTPLGLHHIMGQGIHFGPEPWLEQSARPDWTSIYYHRADSVGLGFDRTEKGNNALGLYPPAARKQWQDPNTCALPYLLWFHHVGWSETLPSGRSLWDEICYRYYSGVLEVEQMQAAWARVKPHVDAQIFNDVNARLAVQRREALNWRDACVLYFQTFSKKPVPAPFKQPDRTLEDMKKIVQVYQLR